MAKLKDVIVGKGKFFMVSDVMGSELLITEDLTPESDVRMDEKEQYYCVQVKFEDEIKDLHLGSGAIKALAEALPKNTDTWKGQVFVIDKVTGKGFNTKTFITYVRKSTAIDFDKQKTITDPKPKEEAKPLESPSPKEQPKSSGSCQDNALPAQSELIRRDMEAIKGAIDAGCTVTDGILINILKETNSVATVVAQQNFEKYKQHGLIYNAGKGWRVA